jgi:predicted DCC family thiol-disulfide oxidoreductase YuxK
MADHELIVLYDEDCGFCRWSLDKVLAWDRHGRVASTAIQSAEGERLLAEVPPETRLESWHVASASGEVSSAGAAGPPLLDVLPGGKPLAFVLRKAPRATERAYRFVASNRERWARLLRIDATCSVRR